MMYTFENQHGLSRYQPVRENPERKRAVGRIDQPMSYISLCQALPICSTMLMILLHCVSVMLHRVADMLHCVAICCTLLPLPCILHCVLPVQCTMCCCQCIAQCCHYVALCCTIHTYCIAFYVTFSWPVRYTVLSVCCIMLCLSKPVWMYIYAIYLEVVSFKTKAKTMQMLGVD